jgi:hypothetical protein
MDYENLPTKTYWLSYSGPVSNLGCCIIDADNHAEAIQKAKDLGLDPGGDVGIVELGPEAIECILDLGKNRLFYEEELIGKPYIRRARDLQDDDVDELMDRGATVYEEGKGCR